MTEQLTREQIEAMEPGRELDCLIIQHVFKKTLWYERPNWYVSDDNGSEKEYTKVPRFSADISAAWQIVEKFPQEVLVRKKGYGFYRCWIAKSNTDVENGYWETARTAPEAICKASLLAVMGL